MIHWKLKVGHLAVAAVVLTGAFAGCLDNLAGILGCAW
jgi:hypothetical protein